VIDAVHPGRVLWVELGDGVGREQSGRRPAVVVSAVDHLVLADHLVTIVPATGVDRGWPNHVPLQGPTGLRRPTFAITEQTKTISRERVVRAAGEVDADCLAAIIQWLDDWLHLPGRREGPGRLARR
jgi:mRNA interferase MazF